MQRGSSRNNADLNESLLRDTANPYDPLDGPSVNVYDEQGGRSAVNTLTQGSQRKPPGDAGSQHYMYHSPALTQERTA